MTDLVKVRLPVAGGKRARVYVNGVRMSGVRHIRIEAGAEQLTTVALELIADVEGVAEVEEGEVAE